MSELGVSFERLRQSVDWSIRQLDTPRKKRREALQQYVGNHYGDGGSALRVPTNFLELAVTIYSRQLAARAPQVLITARHPSMKRQAYEMELALNQVPKEIKLGKTIQAAVVEALFSFASIKVGLCSSGTCVLGHEYGEPFADLIQFDDYFCDMGAKSRKAIQFEGNDYWLPVDDARKKFNNSKIQPDQATVVGDQGQQRAEAITVSEGATLLRDMVWVRDVWIPSTRKVATYSVKGMQLLNVADWKGPDRGPYHILGFSDVPSNLLPLPPVALWRDLHELGNALFRKLAKQADSKKTVAAFAGGNDDDVENLKRSADGDGIKYSGARPEAITVGGIDAPGLAFYLQVRDLFNYFAGNLDSLGGLAPTASTLGQDKLLTEAASARLNAMAETTTDYVRDIFEDIAFYEWNDPVKERDIVKELAGAPEFSVRAKWSADTREGKFEDFDFDIDVFSMQDDSPSTKIQKIGATLERFIFPILPLVKEQGGQLDLEQLVEVLAKYGNIPDLKDIVKFVDPERAMQMGGGAGGEGGMGMPNNTTRTYVRENRASAPTRSGKDNVMAQLLMGGKVQPKEGAALGR